MNQCITIQRSWENARHGNCLTSSKALASAIGHEQHRIRDTENKNANQQLKDTQTGDSIKYIIKKTCTRLNESHNVHLKEKGIARNHYALEFYQREIIFYTTEIPEVGTRKPRPYFRSHQ